MKVKLAKKAGFCFGVKRAMQMAFDEVEKNDDIYALGPLIHNTQAINRFEENGLVTVEDINKIKDNSNVIIRSHGVSKKVYDDLNSKKTNIIDTTCPFVTKIHEIAKQYSDLGYKIIVIGDKNHPEIIGINGWCNDEAIIIKEASQISKNQFNKNEKYCVVSQTTLNKKLYEDIKEKLEELELDICFNNTICSATNVRQESAKLLSEEVDMMIVIGGRHSSNTQKLHQICSEKVKTLCIETVDELFGVDFKDTKVVGVTAGASTPDWIIEEVVNYLNSR